eukprot:6196398-Pleurochrysis_carterae.AAC.1
MSSPNFCGTSRVRCVWMMSLRIGASSLACPASTARHDVLGGRSTLPSATRWGASTGCAGARAVAPESAFTPAFPPGARLPCCRSICTCACVRPWHSKALTSRDSPMAASSDAIAVAASEASPLSFARSIACVSALNAATASRGISSPSQPTTPTALLDEAAGAARALSSARAPSARFTLPPFAFAAERLATCSGVPQKNHSVSDRSRARGGRVSKKRSWHGDVPGGGHATLVGSAHASASAAPPAAHAPSRSPPPPPSPPPPLPLHASHAWGKAGRAVHKPARPTRTAYWPSA